MFKWLFKREKKVILTLETCSITKAYTPLLEVGEVHGKVSKPKGYTGFKLITLDGKEFANVYSDYSKDSTKWYADLDLDGLEFVAKIDYYNSEHKEYGLDCVELKILK